MLHIVRLPNAMFVAAVLAVLACMTPGRVPAEESGSRTPPPQRGQKLEWTAAGTVVEFTHVGNYTYLSVEDGERRVWVAAPHTELEVGARVKVPVGALMENYTSKGLSRVFERIYFVSFIDVEGAAGHGEFSTPGQEQVPLGGSSGVNLSGIPAAAGGVTVARVFDEKDRLTGKEVAVRGRVVKFSPDIMGTNWVHLQDGTIGAGNRADLTVTTDASVEVGDTVLVRGVLLTSRDYGFGYSYDVIIENAEVTVE